MKISNQPRKSHSEARSTHFNVNPKLRQVGALHNQGKIVKQTYEELAKMIDHSPLHPTMTDAEGY